MPLASFFGASFDTATHPDDPPSDFQPPPLDRFVVSSEIPATYAEREENTGEHQENMGHGRVA